MTRSGFSDASRVENGRASSSSDIDRISVIPARRSETGQTSPGKEMDRISVVAIQSSETGSSTLTNSTQEVQIVSAKRIRGIPFGDETNADKKYATMLWWQAGMLMIAETISLGILSLPSVLAAIGFVPGMILILGLGVLATYTGYVLGQFKKRYPWTHSMTDVGDVLAGRIGGEILGAAQILFLVFVMASHILTFSIMLNTVTSHGSCTIVFAFVGMVVCLVCTLPRSLGDISYMSIVSFISIIGAIAITMIGVGIERPGHEMVDVTVQTPLLPAFLAVSNIVFAYAGHVAFFSFISELKYPETYPKALFLLQGVDTSLYLFVAAMVYYYAGTSVKSPALGSTSIVLQKIAYGIAVPTIVVSGVINGHVAAKQIYVRMWRQTSVMAEKSLKAYSSWYGLVAGLWFSAWIIAEAIPVFNDLLSLISALFASWFTYGMAGIFWLHMNQGRYTETWKKMLLTALNVCLVLIGTTIMALGLWSSGVSIASASSSRGSFSCADNSAQSSA